MRDVLLFGGSFDPIHHGHLIVCRAAAEQLGIERVVLIPCAVPPHAKSHALADGADRLAMCRAAVAGDPLFEVSDWELRRSGPSYTLYTVQHFRERAGGGEVYWLLGMDGLRELTSWHRADELVSLCTFVTARRPGVPPPSEAEVRGLFPPPRWAQLRLRFLETPWLEISGTHIRERVRAGRSIRYLTPPEVCALIGARGLYRGAGGAGR